MFDLCSSKERDGRFLGTAAWSSTPWTSHLLYPQPLLGAHVAHQLQARMLSGTSRAHVSRLLTSLSEEPTSLHLRSRSRDIHKLVGRAAVLSGELWPLPVFSVSSVSRYGPCDGTHALGSIFITGGSMTLVHPLR